MSAFSVSGNIVDIFDRRIFNGSVEVIDGKISQIKHKSENENKGEAYIMPGFIDSHVHIESSMLLPSEFARIAVTHGTVATISDPHEIANVCGMAGVDFMIENGNTVPFKFFFGAPSCVPATKFETAGATLDSSQVEQLLQRKEILYLSEMMNFPGVINGDEEVMKKIAAASKNGKLIDGHAPGLRGNDLNKYVNAGISTDHECFTAEEAIEKLSLGMKILIREGSAARNFEALAELINDHSANIMLCSDDKHPDSLVDGHINKLCERAVQKRIDLFKILRTACVNPVLHYRLNVGMLRQNDPADFIIVKDLVHFEVLKTYIDGIQVSEGKKSIIETQNSYHTINNFSCIEKNANEFSLDDFRELKKLPVIEALDGQLITKKIFFEPGKGYLIDIRQDILQISVVNRYHDAPVASALIRNFGLKKGAIASSVAHDSHNIIAVGCNAKSICRAVNIIIRNKGGISWVDENDEMILPLPVAGLMSTDNGEKVAEAYTKMDKLAKQSGSKLAAPYMTLSFMGLLVIPHLKLSDRGLFDGDRFEFVSPFLQ